MSDTEGHKFFHKFAGLDTARQLRDAWIVMETDWGGQVLVTCPVAQVACDEDNLRQLLYDLVSISCDAGLDDGSIANNPGSDGERIYVFTAPPGHGVPGGMGGAANLPELWVHEEFVGKGLREAIVAVLRGSARRLPHVPPLE